MNIADITITSLETITAFNITTGAFKFVLDELQNASIAQSQEITDITGKQGRKLASLKKNKQVTVSGTNGIVSSGLLELQTGSEFENKATEVLWTDYLTVNDDHEATTSWKAIGTSGAEIDALYVKNNDGTLGTKLEQDSSVAAGKFTYTPASKKITLNTDIAAGSELVVFYKRKITADVLSDESDKYSDKCALYIDAIGEDRCANVYRIQFYIPKADFSGDFTFEMGDNQTVHSFEATALGGACGAASSFFTYTIFGVDTADED